MSRGALLSDPDRLTVVRRDGLFDLTPDESFHRSIRLTCKLLQASAAYLKLVDEHWVYLKSAVGPAHVSGTDKQPVGESFAAHIVKDARPLVVSDARADERFCQYEWVRLGHIIAYAGVPLAVDGFIVGALCVVEDRPRQWTDDDLEILASFAEQITAQLTLRLKNAELLRAHASSVRQLHTMRLVMDSAAINSFDWDLSNNHIAWSENLEAMLRMQPGSFVGTVEAFAALVHPEDRESVEAAIEQALSGEAAKYACDFRMMRADDTVRWVLARGYVERDAQGTPTRLIGVDIDITEQMEKQAELQRSENMLQIVLDRTPSAILVTDAQGRFVLSNAAVAHILGGPVSGNAAGPKSGYRLYRADGAPVDPNELPLVRALQGQPAVEAELCVRRVDGSQVTVVAAAAAIHDAEGAIQGAVAVMHDITARKNAEARVNDRNAQLALIAHVSRLLILSDDNEADTLTTAFDAVAKTIGAEMYFNYQPYDAQSMRLCNWGGLTDDERTLFETMRYGELLCGRVAARRQPIIVEDIAHTEIEGSEAVRAAGYGAYAGFPLIAGERLLGTIAFITRTKTHFAEGEIETIQTVCNYVAAKLERNRLTRALNASVDRYQKILDAQTVGVMFWDLAEGRLVDANDAFLEMVGYQRSELASLALTWQQLTPPEYHAASEAELAIFKDSGRLGPYEKEYLCKDGTRKWMLFAGTGLGDDQCVEFCVDITARKQMESALHVAGDSFRRLVEQSPFGVYAVDADFRLVMVSAGAQKVFQTVGPLLGRDFEDVLRQLWPEPFVSEALGHFRRTLVTGKPYHAPSTVEQRADTAQTESYDWKLERMVLPDGRPGVVCYFYDLSERQRLEAAVRESEQRFVHSMEATNDGLWDWNTDTDAVYYSPGYYRILGYPPGGFPATLASWSERVHPEDFERVLRVNMDCVEGRTNHFTVEYRLQASGGGWRWILSRGKCIARDARGHALRLIGTHVDITQRKEVEGRLLEADRRKDEFLATLAHELRNPLAPLRTGLRVLKLARQDADAMDKCVAMMDRQIAHMTRLIDDLLEVSRISGGKIVLQKRPIALADVVRSAVETSLPLIEENEHALTVDLPSTPIHVDGDLVRLAQALANLLNNAAKYTPRGGHIRLQVGQDGGQARIEVADNGIGIPGAMLERVFEIFTQVDESLDKSQGGLGIGLHIVKRLVDKHGGTVAAHSAGPGRGSVFTVRLPTVHFVDKDTPNTWGDVDPTRQAHRRILIVDDNVDAADSLAMMFNALGHDAKTANDGLSALDEADRFRPDLIVLDIGLPKLNGYDVCRHLRERSWAAQVVVVACSGWGRDDDKRKASEAGFDLHMTKPLSATDLQELLVERMPSNQRSI